MKENIETKATLEPKETIGPKFARLIDVKSIVTLTMTAALIGMLFSGIEPTKELLALYCTSYGSIVTYFFTKKGDSNV